MKAKHLLIGATVLGLVILLGGAYLAYQARKSVVIGAILPLSGEAASYGVDARRALELLEQEVDSSGGLRGRHLSLVYEDDRMEEQSAVTAYRAILARGRPAGIVGPMGGAAALALVSRLETDQVVMVSPTASSPRLSGMSRFFFRVWPPDGAEGGALARALYHELGLRRVAMLYEEGEFGQTIAQVFERTLSELGGSVVYRGGFSSDTRDFRPALRTIRDLRPEALYAPGYFAPVAILLRHAAEVAPGLRVIGASPSEDPRLVVQAGSGAEGFLFARPRFDRVNPPPEYVSFVTKYQQKYGSIPGPAATFTYDAGSVLIAAIREVGAAAGPISENLRALRGFRGVTGEISFDARGDVQREFELAVVRAGRFQSYRR